MAGARLSQPAMEVVRLLAMCPDMPAEVLALLRGGRSSISTEQLLRRLESSNLVQVRRVAMPPLLGPRPLRLWSATVRGVDCVVASGLLKENH